MYAIAGGKGGVGKTTTAVNLAVGFQAEGYETVVVDADLGMTNLGQLLDLDVAESIHEVLADRTSVASALTDGPGGIDVLPGERAIDAFEAADPAKLRDVLQTLRADYDVVIADTGAGLTHASLVPFGLADGVVLVTTECEIAATDAGKTASMVREVGGSVVGTVVTRVRHDTGLDAVLDRVGERLLETIPEDETVAGDEPMLATAPDSDPAAAYETLASTLAVHVDAADRPATAPAPTAAAPTQD